jgi:Winged helix DNA-binding domain
VNRAIAEQRLLNQGIARPGRREPADVVAWLRAVQAQEYPAAKWGLALRMPDGTTDRTIERAFDAGRLLRTHVMRPTWHFVTPADIYWMLDLTASRVQRTMASYIRQQELDTTLTRATGIFERALRDGQSLTRAELGAHLARGGVAAKGVRLALLTVYAELEQVICSGPRRGRRFTYALLAERAPRARRLSRDAALAEITRRYFSSHGPATIRDFVWWSGLTSADAKRGLETNRARPEVVDGRTYWTMGGTSAKGMRREASYLLPIYDEYLVAYRDRDAVPHSTSVIQFRTRGSVTFQHALVIAGQVAGTWKAVRNAGGLVVEVFPLRRLTGPERRALIKTTAHYGRFLGTPISLSLA